eukprot:SAG11_NODE_35508_length_266_cov_0.622754_2_plen_27_part_01
MQAFRPGAWDQVLRQNYTGFMAAHWW